MKNILLITSFLIFTSIVLLAQNPDNIGKSEIIENIDGKDYYLHFVRDDETLFNIAKAYGVTVNDIFSTNPESQNGIKSGQILKIRVKDKQNNNRNKPEASFYFYHIVKKKETLYGISKKYGVSIEEIKSLNPEMGDYPKEGQTIKIPEKDGLSNTETIEVNNNSVSHTVQSGETLYGIARQYDVTIGEIKNANPGLTNSLSVGEVLIIPNQEKIKIQEDEPESKEEEPKYIMHTVVPGETLYKIAQENSVSIDTLKKHNPGLTETIFANQIIKIPDTPSPNNYIIHRVTQRDKLVKIARKYDVDYGELLALNPGVPKKVNSGQLVKIPAEIKQPVTQPEIEEPENIEPNHFEPDCERNLANKNKVYNIALLLPLYLEEIDSLSVRKEIDISDLSRLPSFRFVQFYEGFIMAVDSLQKNGMNMNIFVYDVDNSPEKVDKVLAASELSSMDIIVGPFFSKAFSKVARFAKTYEINIINPLSTREEIIHNNPYVFKVKPGMNYQTDQLIDYIETKYPAENIVIVRNNKYKYQAEVSYIRNYLNSKLKMSVFIPNARLENVFEEIEKKEDQGKLETLYTENKVLERESIKRSPEDSTYFSNSVKEVIYVNDSTTGMELNLSKVRKNIVIALANDKVFGQELLSKMNKLRLNHEIILFGIPDWESFDNLETTQLLNLDFHCFSSYLVNYESFGTQNWILNFRERYQTEPSIEKYAFQGFDIGWYFLNALYYYGKDFESCLADYDKQLLHTEFNFENSGNDGFENTHWIMGKYKDYRLIKVD